MRIRTLRRALALPAVERWQALEALLFLAVSRCMLGLLPFRVGMRGLGLRVRNDIGDDAAVPEARSRQGAVLAVATAVSRASAVAPFRAVCLQQALAAALMLRRRGHPAEVYFGLAKDAGGKLSAHAWSKCRGVPVTGGPQMRRYVPVSVFVT